MSYQGNLPSPAPLSGQQILQSGPLANFGVANLPTSVNGSIAYATNGRKSGEAAGSGTGVVVYYSNSAWRRFSDDTAVVA